MADLRLVTDDFARSQNELLSHGGGGGTYDRMEARVARLEDDMKEVKSDLKAIRSDLAYMKGRMDQMPTTIQLLGFVIAVLVASGIFSYLQ